MRFKKIKLLVTSSLVVFLISSFLNTNVSYSADTLRPYASSVNPQIFHNLANNEGNKNLTEEEISEVKNYIAAAKEILNEISNLQKNENWNKINRLKLKAAEKFFHISRIYERNNELKEAIFYGEKMISLQKSASAIELLIKSCKYLSHLYRKVGNFIEVGRYSKKGGEFYIEIGKTKAANECFNFAITTLIYGNQRFLEQKDFLNMAWCCEEIAIIAVKIRKFEVAAKNWSLASRNWQLVGDFYKAAECAKRSAKLDLKIGNRARVIKETLIAALIYSTDYYNSESAYCYLKLAELYIENNLIKDAFQAYMYAACQFHEAGMADEEYAHIEKAIKLLLSYLTANNGKNNFKDLESFVKNFDKYFPDFFNNEMLLEHESHIIPEVFYRVKGINIWHSTFLFTESKIMSMADKSA